MSKYFKSFFTIMSLVLTLFVVSIVGVKAATICKYEKVTSAPTDWSGKYLIVYEDGALAFNGGLTTLDAVSNTISVDIEEGVIEANDATNAAAFTIATGYTIKSTSEYYIGQTSNANGLKSSESTTYTNTLSINSDGTVNIVSGEAYLRYNATSGQNRFRYYKSSTYSAQKAICLYKYVEEQIDATTYTVTYYDGENVIGTDTVIENEVLGQPTAQEKEGYTFIGWYSDPEFTSPYDFTLPVEANMSLYAKYDALAQYTITFESNGGTTIVNQSLYDGDLVEEPEEPTKEGYVFAGWFTDAECTIEWNFGTDAVANDITLYAKWIESVAVTYKKVTNDKELISGYSYIIVASDFDFAMSTSQSTYNRGSISIKKNNNTITFDVTYEVQILILEAGTTEGTYAFNTGDGYLYAASSSSNYLKTQANLTANSSWSISITDGVATIVAQGSYTRNILKYNSSSSLFSCYASGQKEICLYRLVESVEETIATENTVIECQYNVDNNSDLGYTKLRVIGTVYTEDSTLFNIDSIEYVVTCEGYENKITKDINIVYCEVLSNGESVKKQIENHYYAILVLSNADKCAGKVFTITMTVNYADGTSVSVEKTITMGVAE